MVSVEKNGIILQRILRKTGPSKMEPQQPQQKDPKETERRPPNNRALEIGRPAGSRSENIPVVDACGHPILHSAVRNLIDLSDRRIRFWSAIMWSVTCLTGDVERFRTSRRTLRDSH